MNVIETIGEPRARWLNGGADMSAELQKLALSIGAQTGDHVEGSAYPDAEGNWSIDQKTVRVVTA